MKKIKLVSGSLRINAELTLPGLPGLWAELNSVSLADVLRVDLGEVSQVDSAGIALLLEMQKRSSTPFSLMHPPASLKTLLGLYNLTEILPITEETA